jgi:hypothetical protein
MEKIIKHFDKEAKVICDEKCQIVKRVLPNLKNIKII